MAESKTEDRWILLEETVVNREAPYYWEETEGGHGRPVTYATEREALLEIADAMMTALQEFIDDEDAEEIDRFEGVGPVPCKVAADGSITTEGWFQWSPADDQKKWGR